MMESDAQLDVLDALRRVETAARRLAVAAREQGNADAADALKDRAEHLEAQLAGLGGPDEWSGDIDSLLDKASAADAALGLAQGAIDSGEDPASHFKAAVAAAEAAIEVAAILSGRKDAGRSK